MIDVCADLEMREEMVDVKREGKEVDEGRDEEHDDVDNDAEGVEVKYAALGSVHEVVVLDNDQVWVRGSSELDHHSFSRSDKPGTIICLSFRIHVIVFSKDHLTDQPNDECRSIWSTWNGRFIFPR